MYIDKALIHIKNILESLMTFSFFQFSIWNKVSCILGWPRTWYVVKRWPSTFEPLTSTPPTSDYRQTAPHPALLVVEVQGFACSANTSQPNTSPSLVMRVFIPKALNTEEQIHFVENMANWHITLKIFMCSNLEIQIEKQTADTQANIKSSPSVLAVVHLYE